MIINGYNFIIYSLIFISLFLIDYILGKGFVDMFTRMFCKVACFIKKSIREESQLAAMATGKDSTPISITMLIIEIMLLTFTVRILNRYKTYNRGKDRIDELLKESKDALQTTNKFLEKWRLRRINQVPTQYSYLDEEPQEIKPLQLEVPILHMAIVDTLGTARSQLERGDAGDTCNFTDTTLLSVSSLFDDDESISEPVLEDALSDPNIELGHETKSIEFRNRYLWDVMEEDVNNLDD